MYCVIGCDPVQVIQVFYFLPWENRDNKSFFMGLLRGLDEMFIHTSDPMPFYSLYIQTLTVSRAMAEVIPSRRWNCQELAITL